MKVQSFARVAACSAWVWAAAAVQEGHLEVGLKAPEKSLTALIQDLDADQFQTRESATREIWKIGKPALSALQEIAAGKEPEPAYRARELIRKIELHITPETDPAVVGLVERYSKASANEKVALFDQLHKRRAWRQILTLYAAETDADLQTRLQRSVEGVAIVAARECLLNGDAHAARDFLEMAPADAAGLLALADFHRSQGSWDAELKRAKTLKGAQALTWQLALYRAAGNLEAARDAASAAGEIKVSAAMSVLLGDPLPWLGRNPSGDEGGEGRKSYTELAIKRWQGKTLRPLDLEPLLRAANSRNREERENGINSLFLLGEAGLAEKAYTANSPLLAFSYFETLERIPEALKALGLDPTQPDYPGWVQKRVGRLATNDAENELATGNQELIVLANFLERRGLHAECRAAFLKPLAALADQDAKVFTEFLGLLFAGDATMNLEVPGAPLVAKQAAIAWAGDRAERWEDVVTAAFGGQDETLALWNWLAELDPKSTRSERFDGMLALAGIGRDPRRLRDQYLTRAWAAIAQAPVENRQSMIEKMGVMSGLSPDVLTSLKVWDQLPEASRGDVSWRAHILDLSAANRWNDAAAFFQQQIDLITRTKLDPQASLYACVAACLRKAGRTEEAATQDALVEKLALGNDALEIANGYAYGNDYKRAADWWGRATRQCDPGTENFMIALQRHAEMLMTQGDWKGAAAVSEVRAQMAASVDSSRSSPLLSLRLRLQADLGRALYGLKADRAGSIALLENCHRMFPGDGSLADEFFPALRQVGLLKEHDEWFKISWDRMSAVIAQFPNSDNTLNTAAWLASRARRHLDQAEQYLENALALNPDQPAYLDTMAEVQFAKGNRAKALEWSTRAVNFLPADFQLRRQYERFHHSSLAR